MTDSIIQQAIKHLTSSPELLEGRDLSMAMIPRYAPADLKPYFGRDQFAGWCVIVEWAWMTALAGADEMPEEDAAHLTTENLFSALAITTTKQDAKEKETGHDINALLALMREVLPAPLHRWLHFGATSYDIISTAYALQMKEAFGRVFLRKANHVAELWQARVEEHAETLQLGRTHRQPALPVTVGFWLATLLARFNDTVGAMEVISDTLPGKFSGAVGTYAAQRAFFRHQSLERLVIDDLLELHSPLASTQIAPPEAMARLCHEFVLMSGVLANFAEDVRSLQAPEYGEVDTPGSTSSTMSHKTSNPVTPENISGMLTEVRHEHGKVLDNLVSDFQRDLRNSGPMRGFHAAMGYAYQQLLNTEKILKNLTVNKGRCRQNLDTYGRLVTAEVLHLALQREGVPDAHAFVNKTVVPAARAAGTNLYVTLGTLRGQGNEQAREALALLDPHPALLRLLDRPERYTGDAESIAHRFAWSPD